MLGRAEGCRLGAPGVWNSGGGERPGGSLVEAQGRLLVFAVRQVPERWPRQLAHESLIGQFAAGNRHGGEGDVLFVAKQAS